MTTFDEPEDLAEPTTLVDELTEWYRWHMESEHEYDADWPPLRATITIDPGDYL